MHHLSPTDVAKQMAVATLLGSVVGWLSAALLWEWCYAVGGSFVSDDTWIELSSVVPVCGGAVGFGSGLLAAGLHERRLVPLVFAQHFLAGTAAVSVSMFTSWQAVVLTYAVGQFVVAVLLLGANRARSAPPCAPQ